MRQAPKECLVSDGRGLTLHTFHRVPEDTRFDDAAVDLSLVALWHGDRLLMVYERDRATWELPGGGIDPGESPREAAVRELAEESGQVADELRFTGYGLYTLGRSQRLVYGAVYTGLTSVPRPFTPNEEIAAIHWRAAEEPFLISEQE
ncbi:NUDIX hydrolase [Streptomyces sp. F63]|uniref:NUDIX hydrolase n=1 Tax=Streptomyces sp. F63 TaxID=2824887 RepID=UPI001B37654F|nr:NUDIX hydrolase [Streptomyces sp. F63]MBQ0987008.1 NUDIX hydrolase [Streptomyces sp. F63]